jgi:hypothetical protein
MQTEKDGLFVLGNRFIAAAREAMYLIPLLKDQFIFHRAYHFLVANGVGALFDGYADSLDHTVSYAWTSLDSLKAGGCTAVLWCWCVGGGCVDLEGRVT